MTFEEINNRFIQWLKANDAYISDKIRIEDYRSQGAGRGVIAIDDIEDGEILFTIPKKLTITSTSSKELASLEDISTLEGWTPLILTMMFEATKPDSFWRPYFDILPSEFETPIFWNSEERQLLECTGVYNKIGKEEAEETFHNVIEPLVKRYPKLFNVTENNLKLFHRIGSLIMAYSFEDESEDTPIMIPLADTLNHLTGGNNAKLLFDDDSFSMQAVAPIKKGNQVYNTYGDLCNADLLRKYGFVSVDNPFDIVEVSSEDVINSFCPIDDKLKEKKIDFLLEEDILDDCFVIEKDGCLPPEMIICAKVAMMTSKEFKKLSSTLEYPSEEILTEMIPTFNTILEEHIKRYQEDMEASTLEGDQKIHCSKVIREGELKILKEAKLKLGEYQKPAKKAKIV